MYKSLFYVAALWGSIVNISLANSTVEIFPVQYSFDQAPDCGTLCYQDTSPIPSKLIDGVYASNPTFWSPGESAKWVGWKNDPLVNIDFDFGTAVRVDTINIGSVQDKIGDAVLPEIDIFSGADGSTWNLITSLSVPESSANDDSLHTFNFDNLGIDAQYVRISLAHSGSGPWTFADEVDFVVATPIPPAVWLFGSGLVALFIPRRAKSQLSIK